MLANAFIGQAKRPSKAQIARALAASHPLWQDLVSSLKQDLKLDKEEWNSYSTKAGWSLRLQFKKRNILYLAPGNGSFLASFVLGDRALAAAKSSNLPPDILKILDEAKRYPEGTAVRLEVHSRKDVEVVKTLARIKLEN